MNILWLGNYLTQSVWNRNAETSPRPPSSRTRSPPEMTSWTSARSAAPLWRVFWRVVWTPSWMATPDTMITTNIVQDIWFFNCQSIPIQWQCVDTSEAFIWVIALNFSDWFAFPVRCVTKIPTSRIDTGKGGGHNHWGQPTSSSSERRSSPDLALDSVCSSVVEPARLTDLDRIANFSSSSSGNIWSRLISSSSSSKTSIEPRLELEGSM